MKITLNRNHRRGKISLFQGDGLAEQVLKVWMVDISGCIFVYGGCPLYTRVKLVVRMECRLFYWWNGVTADFEIFVFEVPIGHLVFSIIVECVFRIVNNIQNHFQRCLMNQGFWLWDPSFMTDVVYKFRVFTEQFRSL